MEIIYSDADIIVVNKPPGLVVHGGISVFGDTLTNHLLAQFPEIRTVGDDPATRPGIVHRLDKDTSGVMVVARTRKSFDYLKQLFKARRVEKIYHAIVCGMPGERQGIISYPVGRLVKNPLKRGVQQRKIMIRGARDAVTIYRMLKKGATYSLLELRPSTGRMHQLRVHLKAINHPVACDIRYGGKNVCCPTGVSRHLLHAQSLSFHMTDGSRLFFEADPPEDFRHALEQIF